MLEIKDGELSGVLSSTLTSPINFKLNAGDSLCIYAWEQSLGQALVDTVVGLRPLKKGYFTMDGDLIDAQSVAYFRQKFAFVPRQLDFPLETVDELLDYMLSVDYRLTCEQIKAEWLRFGFEDSLFKKLLERTYMVLDLRDDVLLPGQILNYLQGYLHSGGAIIMASNHESMKNFCTCTLSSPIGTTSTLHHFE